MSDIQAATPTVSAPSPIAGLVPARLDQLAEDLRTLAWLHTTERDPATWLALHAAGFPEGLVAVPADGPEAQAMDQALAQLRSDAAADPQATADQLAVDFADIYLTHALRASPYESVWRDEDHLVMQGPTFEVRQFYREHGVVVTDRHTMPDDHLAHQLEFIARLLDQGQAAAAAKFMDAHLMLWLPDFATRVAARAATPVYALLALLTLRACQNLRAQLPAAPAAAA